MYFLVESDVIVKARGLALSTHVPSQFHSMPHVQ